MERYITKNCLSAVFCLSNRLLERKQDFVACFTSRLPPHSRPSVHP